MSKSTENIFTTSGILLPKDACVVIVRTAWNPGITDALEEGCCHILKANGVAFEIIAVPGAFEIPFAIKKHHDTITAVKGGIHAYVALGCVLRGDTPHFDYVCRAVTDGILQLNLQLPLPVIFGVLTVDNESQANERIGGVHGHKGEEAAATALKMIAWAHSL